MTILGGCHPEPESCHSEGAAGNWLWVEGWSIHIFLEDPNIEATEESLA
jgi:hypothetical protein